MGSAGALTVDLIVNAAKMSEGFDLATEKARRSASIIGRSLEGIGSGVGKLGAILGDFGGVVGETFGTAGKVVGEFASVLARTAGSAGVAGAGVAGGMAAAAAAALTLSVRGADVVERLNLISQKTGIAARDLLVFEAAGKTSGLSLEQMLTAMRRFDQALTNTGRGASLAQSVLRSLGVTSKDNREALLQVADAFAKMDDGVRKVSDSVALFGKSGAEIIPFLNKGRAGILEFENIVDVFGPKINSGVVQATENWHTSLEKVSLAFQDLEVRAMVILPTITKAVDILASSLRGVSVSLGTAATAFKALLTGQNVPAAIAQYLGQRTAETAPGNSASPSQFQTLQSHYQPQFERDKAGSQAQFNLEQQREKIADAIAADNFKIADELQKQIPALEAAVKAEKEAAAAAQKRLQIHQEFEAAMKTPSRPMFTREMYAGQAAAKQQTPDLSSVPQLPTQSDVSGLVPNMQAPLNAATVLSSFHDTFDSQAQRDVATIRQMITEFQQLASVGAISQGQLSQAMNTLNGSLSEANRQILIAGGGWKGFIAGLESTNTEKLKQGFFDTLTQGVNNFSNALANFIVTGRGGFLQVLQQMEKSLISLGVQFVLTAALKKVFDSLSSDSQDTGLAQAEVLRQAAIGEAAAEAATSAAWGGPAAAIAAAAITMASLEGITALAEGGPMSPGHAYLVGEKHPEILVAGMSGRVYNNAGKVPGMDSAGGGAGGTNITVNHHVSAIDSQSFRGALEEHSEFIAKSVLRQLRNSGLKPNLS